jgi:hypothetical protein
MGYRDIGLYSRHPVCRLQWILHEELPFNDLPIGVSILTISGGVMHRAVQSGAFYQ